MKKGEKQFGGSYGFGGYYKIRGTAVSLTSLLGTSSVQKLDAEVVELVDALASGASGCKPVGVRVPPSAL